MKIPFFTGGLEEISLELLSSALKTKRTSYILNTAKEVALQKGKKGFAEKIDSVVALTQGGYSLLDALYYVELLSDQTYHFLKIAEDKNVLTSELIEEYLEDLRNRKKLMSGIIPALIMPLFLTFASALIAGLISYQLKDILKEFYPQAQGMIAFYITAGHHPLMFGLGLGGIATILLLLFILFIFTHTSGKEMAIYQASSIILPLSTGNIGYGEIFHLLAQMEKNKKLRKIFETIAEDVRFRSIGQALAPFFEVLGLSESLILRDYISRREDENAWRYLRNIYRVKIQTKIKSFIEFVPFFAYLGILFCLIIGLTPISFVMSKLMNMM